MPSIRHSVAAPAAGASALVGRSVAPGQPTAAPARGASTPQQLSSAASNAVPAALLPVLRVRPSRVQEYLQVGTSGSAAPAGSAPAGAGGRPQRRRGEEL